VLARITSTSDPATVIGADIVIESVLEDPAIKAEVMRRIEPHLAPDAIVASNTSSLSVTSLAEHVSRPANFIGMHFFAPVEQMELVEIVRGALTSDQTFARALDLARRLRRVPIVASDKPGFFTTRVIMTYIEEGLAMLVEGIPPSTIEQAAGQAGYPSPVLRLADDLGFEVLTAIDDILHRDAVSREASSSTRVLAHMLVELDRPGRHEGRGFYDYTDGLVPRLWPGLAETFESTVGGTTPSLEELKDRLLFVEALEAVRCLDDGVIGSVAEANIGSLLGIGYPSWTGGPLQYINSYPDGVPGFVHRSRELANRYGPRFEPPDSLVARAEGAAP
jgi:3-hydroxyacyl-CoA dehydrogenase/enoyl-CoA hydratase/3-hydroxybutyryl-CoA epimerase